MAYVKRYPGGFVDRPAVTTPADSVFLNAVEAALLKLYDTDPAADGQVLQWIAASSKYGPALILDKNVAAGAAIAKTKLAALNIGDADIAAAGLTNAAIAAAASIAATKVVSVSDGWQPIAATLTYSSTDGPTFVVTTGGVDLTASIPLGSRIKLTHAAATKYFLVTAINATTITLYGGTGYTLAATAITAPFFSIAKAPVGFNLDPTVWTETLTDSGNRTQASPVSGTWYNPGGLFLDVPIGLWQINYSVPLEMIASSDSRLWSQFVFSVGAATGAGDFNYYQIAGFNYTISSNYQSIFTMQGNGRGKVVSLGAKTRYYLNANYSGLGTSSSIGFNGTSFSATMVRAVSAFL